MFIVSAKRTPFGTFGGKFRNTSASELQTVAAKAALAEAKVNPELVDSVVLGHVLVVRFHLTVLLPHYTRLQT